ncbi:hypothetical protein MJO52_05125 [Microbulbifer variabilis]|uniref:Uncharacterized protein n=1 Tax=Microbulbifer variabilis TaxID=266805 RepID=A0ABY4VE72_9GAMM|nr:hypothetical protein [Microbulbifer variabilis]USD22514.1 hypothetical protein MJO52_05125 [Microbulbifer variabilis]
MKVVAFGPEHTKDKYESDIFKVIDDENGLTITVDTVDVKGSRMYLIVNFEFVRGYRYLDEGDLMCYWESGAFTPPVHVFQVLTGGWSNGEACEPDMLNVSKAIEIKEWFVGTTNGCISILSDAIPTIKSKNA